MRKYKYYVAMMGAPKGRSNSMTYFSCWWENNVPLETTEAINDLLETEKETYNLDTCYIINITKVKR